MDIKRKPNVFEELLLLTKGLRYISEHMLFLCCLLCLLKKKKKVPWPGHVCETKIGRKNK